MFHWADRNNGQWWEGKIWNRRCAQEGGRGCGGRKEDTTALKNDGIQYRGRFESEPAAVSQPYKESVPSPCIFLYYRRGVRQTGGHKKRIPRTKKNKKTYLTGAEKIAHLTSPVDHTIRQDFKADCSCKVKNFLWALEPLRFHARSYRACLGVSVKGERAISFSTAIRLWEKYLLPPGGCPSRPGRVERN